MADWHARYRRLIDLYRSALTYSDPLAARVADLKAEELGEGWVTRGGQVNPNVWMSAGEISERFGISLQTIYAWYRRHPDRIRREKGGNGRVVFWLADVLKYRAEKSS